MFNRFKLWFYRNDSKIIITIVLVVSFYVAIKSTNNYYKNEAENKNVVENITAEENNTTENETM